MWPRRRAVEVRALEPGAAMHRGLGYHSRPEAQGTRLSCRVFPWRAAARGAEVKSRLDDAVLVRPVGPLDAIDQQVYGLDPHPGHVLSDGGQARLKQIGPFEVVVGDDR